MASPQFWFGKFPKAPAITAKFDERAGINVLGIVPGHVKSASKVSGKKIPEDHISSKSKHRTSWWRTERTLTSRRVSVLLSNPEDNAKLLKAIRDRRSGVATPFKVSKTLKGKLTE
jgi:hypothetical protein